jgi:AAT family amino acid transporter
MWQTEFFDYWPFSNQFLSSSHPLKKGGILTGTTLLVYLVLIIGLIFFIIGNYGITYFNWNSLTKYGKLGQDVMSTRETTSWAFICLSVPFLLLSSILLVGVGKDIWPETRQPGQGLANWLLMAMAAIPLFLIFFHPHIGSMFYPAQIYMAVPPWWKQIAHTNSAEYGLGIFFCTVIVLFITLKLWEGRPWTLVTKQPLRFLFVAVGGLALGFLLFSIQLYIMDYLWDEAYMGGQNDASFGWRYSHTVTMGNFILVCAIIIENYFGRLFAKMGTTRKGILTTALAILAGLVFAWCYYAWAPALLGVCPGVSHPSENPSAFLVMVIVLLNIQDYFMDGWPGYGIEKTRSINQDLKIHDS